MAFIKNGFLKPNFKIMWSLFCLLFVVVMDTTASGGDFVCPPNEEIAPCTCWTFEGSPGELYCVGPSVTQLAIDNLFSIVRQYNNVATLPLFAFSLYNTQMTSLELTPLANTTFHAININSNLNLTTILTPNEDDMTPYRFTVNTLGLSAGLLSNGGEGENNFVSLFKTLDPTLLKVFIVSQNELDFVPNVDSLSELWELKLGQNLIQSIGGGQFKKCGKLTHLFLHDNLIRELGPDAFLFEPLATPTNQSFFIYLSGNNLTDDTIDLNHGLDSILGRATVVGFQGNQFEFVSQEKFLKFLQVHEQNGLDFSGNPLICDERMQWLKDGRELFEHRMTGMYCENDPGHTIFDTDLLPGPKTRI